MSSYQEQTSGSLPEWNQNVMDLLGQAQAQAGKAYTPYTGQLVAGNTPGMNAAFAQAQQSQGNWKPELDKSAQLLQQGATNQYYGQGANLFNKAANTQIQGLGQPLYDQSLSALQGAMGTDLYGAGQPLYDQASNLFSGAGQFDQNELQKYLNPYLGGVVGEIGRLGNEQFQNQVLPGLTGAFSGLGQHGSARQAMMMSDAAARNQREVLGQQATALNTGYTNAMGDYLNWARQQQSSAQGLAGIGQQQYNQLLGQANLGLQGAGQLFGMGQQQYNQGLGQAQLNMGAAQGLSDIARNQQSGLLQAGSALGNVAQARQQLAIGDYGQLLNAGQLQQQQKQKELDAKYATWQQEQQYPWQQLGNWADLLGKAGTPQSNTSWQAAFKKGGLARYADGGRFPDPMSILDRMRADGMTDEEIERDFDTGGSAYRSRLITSIRRAQDIMPAEEELPQSAQNSLMQRAFDERVKLLERARGAKYLQPMEEGNIVGNIGEALLRASAEGPAHWGQILGRAGTAYFDKQNAVQNENKARELARLNLEEKITPEIGRGGLGSGAMPGYVSVIGQDGKRYMVNRLNPNDRIEIGTGINQRSLHEAADRYAREQNKDAIFKDDAEREARYNYHKQQYIDNYLRSRGGGTSGSMFPEVPGSTIKPGRAYDPASYGAAEKEAAPVDESSKVILSPSESEQQKKIGASEGARYDEMQKVGSASRGQLNTLSYLENNLDQITTGKLTPLKTEVKAWLKPFGIDLGNEDIPPAQAVQSISGQLALSLRNTSEGNGMPGSLSDNDLKFLKSMTPNLSNDPEGNKLIINYSRKIAQRNAEVAQKARDYIQNNPRGVLDAGFYRDLEKWVNENELFKDERQRTQKTFDEMPDASLYDGKRLKGDDGTIYRSVNGQWVKE